MAASAASYHGTSWRGSAACRGIDPELFFPIGKTGPALAETQRVKAVCARHTGRLVTSGALILCLAFIALGGVPVTDVKILATGLAAGIIIDATIIRGILTPARVALFGRVNWWLPGPAARMLRITPLAACRQDPARIPRHARTGAPADIRTVHADDRQPRGA